MQGGDSPSVKAAGLPNIIGSGGWGELFPAMEPDRCSGALWINTEHKRKGSGSTDNGNYTIDFDASKSNQIYGSSSTVQPPSICLIPQIRF